MKRISTIKVLLMSALFSFVVVEANAQVILEEDFNTGWPSSWTTIDGDGANYNANLGWMPLTGAWRLVDDYDSTAVMDSVAVSSSWYDPVTAADDWMITPMITLGGNSDLTWEEKAQDPAYPDGYEVRISTTTPDASGFNANPALYTVAAASNPTSQQSVSLANYAGLPVYIAWHNNSTDQFVLYVDNVNIVNQISSSIEGNEISNMDVSLYPNPVNNNLNINVALTEASNVQMQVISGTGQVIYSETISGVQNLVKAVNTENWASGVYHLQVATSLGVQTERFVKM
jgi:hypothetical protein